MDNGEQGRDQCQETHVIRRTFAKSSPVIPFLLLFAMACSEDRETPGPTCPSSGISDDCIYQTNDGSSMSVSDGTPCSLTIASSTLPGQCVYVSVYQKSLCFPDCAAGTEAPQPDLTTVEDMTASDMRLDIATDTPDSGSDIGTDVDAGCASDRDGDGVCDDEDACPDDELGSRDSDLDGVCDYEDQCPTDSTGSVDSDGDGVCDGSDAFPNDPTETRDSDGDGTGDEADDDDDNDGILDAEEIIHGLDCVRTNPVAADTDGDGIDDTEDQFPADPYPEFILQTNSAGTIDLHLSNRDGTFQPPVQIGQLLTEGNQAGAPPLTYGPMSIGDFDNNGQVDFIVESSAYGSAGTTRDFYFFTRTKLDEFEQHYIGPTDVVIAGGVILDADQDFQFDIARLAKDMSSNGLVTNNAYMRVFLNNGIGASAPCVWATEPGVGCFFTQLPEKELPPPVSGIYRLYGGRQAVNLNASEDLYPDLALFNYSGSGNVPVDVYLLFGNGDGTFQDATLVFTHNKRGNMAPANGLLFADFDGDDVGDVVMGFDDDGQPGAAWFYKGTAAGSFTITAAPLAIDLNPVDNTGSDRPGFTGSGKTFDVDFDGNTDILIGYDVQAWTATSGELRLYMGKGDGTFEQNFSIIGAQNTIHRHAFQIPQRLCTQF